MTRRLALLLILSGGARAAEGQALAAAYDPEGVHVDAQGVLRSRTVDPDPRLAELRKAAKSFQKDGKLLYVSLPRLFEEARRAVEGGKPLPESMRHLGGLTKLQYVFVYPDAKDLVVAGPAEPFDARSPYRPLGKISGRPVLHLDDLVTALRAFAGGKKPDRLGCDIDVTKEIQERVANKARAVGPTASVVGFRKVCDQIAEAGGPQPVKFHGLDAETRFAFVCVEADYRLKQLALGLLPPISKVETYRSQLLKPEVQHRFSLESNDGVLRVSPDGAAFELRGPPLKVSGGILGKPESTPDDMSPAGRRFAASCNENFEALARQLPAWADLCNLADLAVLGALIEADRLAARASWDLSWVLDPKGYAVTPMKAPASAATLCTYVSSGADAIFVTGGVWLRSPGERARDEKVAGKAARPDDGWSAARPLSPP